MVVQSGPQWYAGFDQVVEGRRVGCAARLRGSGLGCRRGRGRGFVAAQLVPKRVYEHEDEGDETEGDGEGDQRVQLRT
jgi:hypothetical protein